MCFSLPVIFSSLSVSLCLHVVVFFIFFFFSQLVLFKRLPHLLRGGARQCVSSCFFSSFSLPIYLLCFGFFFVFFRFSIS